MDSLAAVGTRIFDFYFFVCIAVDQQQEIDRSPNVEGFVTFDRNGMEVMA